MRPSPPVAAPLPLVLVPGLLCTAEVWRGQIEQLGDRVEAFVPDVTGHDTVGELADVALASAPERFTLAGFSMGGYIALEMARAAPRRVLGLALLGTNARPEAPDARRPREELIRLAEEGRFHEVPGRLIPRWLAPANHMTPALTEAVERMARAVGPAAFVRQQRAIIGRSDARAALATMRAPTLVLGGETTSSSPPDQAAEMADLVPGATLRLLPECGHMAPLERPAAVAEAMTVWLAQVRATADL